MMSFFWRSAKGVNYPDLLWHISLAMPGVRFATKPVSVGSRLDLMLQMRELLAKHDFLKAGNTFDQTEAAISELMAKALYLRWGIQAIQGLSIGGTPATVDNLIDAGPESLCEEMVSVIRDQLELTDAERKNS